ncbi:MAG: HD domain-containing protein [Myxococcales bacterium]|nr:HD domain-containing protein [Myxococcales bacterium]
MRSEANSEAPPSPPLRALLEADPRLSALLEDVAPRLDEDPGHDLEHALRVGSWMQRIDPSLPLASIAGAALMHDLVNLPKDSPARAEASSRSGEAARPILKRHGYPGDAIESIVEAIEDHGFSRGRTPRSALGRALQDADRLEALGALGLMRTFSTGARMNARYFHAEDPWAERRERDDRRYSIDHFFTKLLVLPETLQTEIGRREARRRAEFLYLFLDQLADELGLEGPRPIGSPRIGGEGGASIRALPEPRAATGSRGGGAGR